jgi:hypothetical protein
MRAENIKLTETLSVPELARFLLSLVFSCFKYIYLRTPFRLKWPGRVLAQAGLYFFRLPGVYPGAAGMEK